MDKAFEDTMLSMPRIVFPSLMGTVFESAERAKAIDVLGEALYIAYYGRILRYFSFRLLDKGEAEDLAQTVFLKIFLALKRELWDGAGDICYIFTVARNTLIDHFRKNKYTVIVSDEMVESVADSVTASGPIEMRESRECIMNALGSLHTFEAEAVTLRYFADMEYRAIAEKMGKREDAVRQLVHRGLKALKVILEPLQAL